MRDGCTLVADLVRPAGRGRHPVVVVRTPYDRTAGPALAQHTNAMRLAELGIAVLVQDVRGCFGSEGEFYPFAHEADDGVDTIEWTADQPWSNGRVGLAGASYLGYAQALAALRDPSPLCAWFPVFTPLDAHHGWAFEGEAFRLAFNLAWTMGVIAPADRRSTNRDELLTAFDRWTSTVRRPVADHPELMATPAARHYFDWLVAAHAKGYWSAVSAKGVGTTRAPAIVVGGWFDVFCAGSVDLFGELSAGRSGGSHRLVMGPWVHAAPPTERTAGDRDFGRDAALDLIRLQEQWFAAYLLDGGEPPGPRVQYFLTGADTWIGADEWPPPFEPMQWWPAAGGTLDRIRPSEAVATFSIDAEQPTPSIGGRMYAGSRLGLPATLRSGQVDMSPLLLRRDVASFRSEPLSRSLTIGGPIHALIRSGSDRAGADVCATLVDVDELGRPWNIAEGTRRLHGLMGDPARFEVDLGPAAHVFERGHRVGLIVSGMAFPRVDRMPAEGTSRRTLVLGGSDPSHLVLPVVES